MADILISVIVPIYNMEKYLPQCMDSILHQTYSNLEIILVDDGSKDSSPDMCDDYALKDNRIRVIHQENKGLSGARNSGMAIATGDYISLVDPDDWLELNTYEILINTIKKSSVMPDMIRFNAYRDGRILNPHPFNGEYDGKKLYEEVLLPTIGPEQFDGPFVMGNVWVFLYRKDFINENNLKFILYNRLEDRLYNISALIKAKSIICIPDVLYYYRINTNSLSNNYNPLLWERELEYIQALDEVCRNSDIKEDIKHRFANDVMLRAVINVDYVFFSNNSNSFLKKKKKIKEIISNPYVINASKNIKKKKVVKKKAVILFFIKHNLPLLLSMFEEFVLFVSKIKRRNG